MELNDELYSEILRLSSEGDALCDDGEYQCAKEKFLLALGLVPTPKSDWEAATWLFTALGEVSFLSQSYEEAVDYLFDAINCPDGLANPFIMLRLGEALFETGADVSRVNDYLMRAFLLGGLDIFEGENDKYFELIKNLIPM